MEIKGEDFIKNVQIKREQTELEERLMELESQAKNINSSSKNPYEQNNPYASNDNFTYEEEVNKTESELDDILLGASNSSQNKDNKKKYIVLGLVLAVLFLITIIIFRLLDNQTKVEDDSLTKKETIEQDKPLNDNIEQQYQKIVNEKLKSIEDLNNKTEKQNKDITEAMDLNNIQKEEKKVEAPKPLEKDVEKVKELKKDIFNVESKTTEKKVETPKAVVKKPIVKKEVVKPTPKPVVKTTKKVLTNEPSGTFIQVGAFSKNIDKKYMDNLRKSKFKYVFYKVNVKGTTFTKVLVGPFKSRSDAINNMNNVKSKLNISSAFIMKF
ncbi:Sporulation domain protein [Arcobacter nitrofigilis DSM 7299]|uniref:Sporulation domain protein n=1 Tax=Arcobacter nitrofigilis (strain ATCC 33309 / DSM 7299 / CCUG 15893 / LMG 7604 / NCTC 12251 / CI) TaxID=572480 RepID=D5V307_ARCNC|nr:SPOR domain-containing protein [Arcobacter nitrofigilis]ADG92589.1 Sporulation domain protein [Arcobacter nitrofigilis DSM 7299]